LAHERKKMVLRLTKDKKKKKKAASHRNAEPGGSRHQEKQSLAEGKEKKRPI